MTEVVCVERDWKKGKWYREPGNLVRWIQYHSFAVEVVEFFLLMPVVGVRVILNRAFWIQMLKADQFRKYYIDTRVNVHKQKKKKIFGSSSAIIVPVFVKGGYRKSIVSKLVSQSIGLVDLVSQVCVPKLIPTKTRVK